MSTVNEWKQKPLTPVVLDVCDPAHPTVDDLLHALKEDDILNIAVTGPYGSGKSSVLKTVKQEASKEFSFLVISLATLEIDDSLVDVNYKPGRDPITLNEKDREKAKEVLNRKIEYSILQQLVYRETLEQLPFSRLKKIRHLSYSFIRVISCLILALLAFITIVFFPSANILDLIYSIFNVPATMQIAIRLVSFILLLMMVYEILKYLIRNFGGMRLEHVNVGGNEINMNDEGSIFNRYLDEILYFFQCTDYNVVIIEDLDRFDNPEIFLKLRELNQLINNSKIVGRKIRFVYVVKDDIFKDASRSKFFDYITTVIPVITTSNSKDKLREALSDLGHARDVKDDSIRDIAFHIDDMRLLYNIANEYHQYSMRLNIDNEHPLDCAKMLAMITIKNYYPHDFSKLHKREGKLYECLCDETKRSYTKLAIDSVIKEREEFWKRRKDEFEKSRHASLAELRLVYLMRIVSKITYVISKIVIDNNIMNFIQVANSEESFNNIIKSGTLNYRYLRGGNELYNSSTFNFSDIEKEVNSAYTYEERKAALLNGNEAIANELANIELEKKRVSSMTVEELLLKFKIYREPLFTNIGLSEMEEDFIRNGLIAEDYFDYISYFYPGMTTLADHQLCRDMRLDRKPSYDAHIDNIDTFMLELPKSTFQYESVLNIRLVDYLAEHFLAEKDYYDLLIDLLLSKHPSEFMVMYIEKGKYVGRVWKRLMENSAERMWSHACTSDQDKQPMLFDMWFRTCERSDMTKAQKNWADTHYSEIELCYPDFDEEKKEYFTKSMYYQNLNESDSEMLTKVIGNECYTINENNMPIIVSHLRAAEDITNLHTLEEMAKALDLNLINCTWSNIHAYYEEADKTIDSSMVGFIQIHQNDIQTCEVEDKYKELWLSLLEYAGWDDIVYDVLCNMNPFAVDITDLMKGLKNENLLSLVNSKKVNYSYDNFIKLNLTSAIAACSYLFINREHYNYLLLGLRMLKTPLVKAILNDSRFNLSEYQELIRILDPNYVEVNASIAIKISIVISQGYIECDNTILIYALALCSDKTISVSAAARIIENCHDNELITSILSALGGKYKRLTEFHISEKFDSNPSNKFLIETLDKQDYISSFTENNEGIKANTKNYR